MAKIQAISPIDGGALGSFTITQPEQIQQQLQSAKLAASAWAQLSVKARLQKLAPLNRLLLANLDRICDTVCQTSGKVSSDALLGELIPILELQRYYQKHAVAILKPQRVFSSPLTFPFATAKIERRPFGVVAVISPWNYPFQLSISPMLSALIAGNAVILKASELSLPVAELLLSLFAELDLPTGLVQAVTGDGETGQQLIAAGPDLVVFTGSLKTGRAVMQAAAQHPIPVMLELGGKDAMLVFAKANLQRACQAALYGAFSNSGQVCMSIERLYVQQACFAAFLQLLLTEAAKLSPQADLGAMTSEQQFAILQAQYDDAIAQGAKASGPFQRDGNYLKPIVLWNVNHNMRVMREESFGPILAVMAFNDDAEAVRLANDSEFGLNTSIWSQDLAQAESIAQQLQVGNWAINDVIKNAGHPALPFGGVKHSGFGRYRGAEGLRNFSYPVSGLTNRSRLAKEPNWFPYNQQGYEQFKSYIDFVYSEDSLLKRLKRNWPALMAFRQYSAIDVKQSWQNFKQLLPWQRDY
jgi:acyl-CoA reductase-like NAD-dependent aldehyde dehydrogenase